MAPHPQFIAIRPYELLFFSIWIDISNGFLTPTLLEKKEFIDSLVTCWQMTITINLKCQLSKNRCDFDICGAPLKKEKTLFYKQI